MTIQSIESKVVETLKTIFDPEIPVNIYELGLIYEISIDDNNKVEIKMTLTSPNCPMVDDLLSEINDKVKAIEGVSDVILNIVFDPPWDKNMMSDAALLDLGLI
ncbi:MAG: FeS assembly SUF system protein [Bacteroidetes bacterium GWA2_32_17]|nr:MAG: FeS assembly SUF system protein [Bacteroidetes bacterium GWA2_32_17]